MTRARAQARGLVAPAARPRRVRDRGAAIRIEPLAGPPIDAADYDVVCVTSPNARACCSIAWRRRPLAGGPRVAAVGPGTAAALREVGLVADLVAERFVAEGLVEALAGPRRRASACS